jgi:hypothetical protein
VTDENGHLPSSNRPAITGDPTPSFPNPFTAGPAGA